MRAIRSRGADEVGRGPEDRFHRVDARGQDAHVPGRRDREEGQFNSPCFPADRWVLVPRTDALHFVVTVAKLRKTNLIPSWCQSVIQAMSVVGVGTALLTVKAHHAALAATVHPPMMYCLSRCSCLVVQAHRMPALGRCQRKSDLTTCISS